MGMNLRYSPLEYNGGTNSFNFGGAAVGGFHTAMPFVGREFYLVASKSLNDNKYYDRLLNYYGIPDGDIFTALADAYAATKTDRNDVIYVTPGSYIVTASLTWAKHHTHLVGLCWGMGGVDSYAPHTLFETVTANVANVLTVSGHNNSFWNVAFANRAADADNLSAVNLTSYGNYFNNCHFCGCMASTQSATAAAASLYIGNAGLSRFDKCVIGQDVWSNRSGADQGVLRFTSTSSRPNNISFNDCEFRSTGSTVTCVMVAVPHAYATGRNILFKNCIFTHFDAAGVSLNQCFHTTSSGQKHTILLHNCSCFGIDEWQDDNLDMVIGTMPITGTGGGLHIEQAGVAGA